MSRKSDLLDQVVLLKNELNTAVSRNNCLKDEQLIVLSQRIDDIVICLKRME